LADRCQNFEGTCYIIFRIHFLTLKMEAAGFLKHWFLPTELHDVMSKQPMNLIFTEEFYLL
jgi:hypothetical protein